MDAHVAAGQAPYNRVTLAVYDQTVLGPVTRWIWGCPVSELLRPYHDNVGARHLELGVGTGYFLDHCRFPVSDPDITLGDLNASALEYTARRLSRYRPATVRANVLEPLPVPDGAFDSVALNFVLHCVPGDLRAKGEALRHAAAACRPGGRVFGATILGLGVRHNPAGKVMLRVGNAMGGFHNRADRLEDLAAAMDTHFTEHQLRVRGRVALFRGTV